MSQSRVIPETERAKYTRDPPDGIIYATYSIANDTCLAPADIEIGGLGWETDFQKAPLDEKEFLFVSLIPQSLEYSTPWNIELTAEYIIVHDSDPGKNVSQMHHYVLRDLTEQGCYLMPWDEMMDKEKGFVVNDDITVIVRLTILKGLNCNPAFDFSASGDIRSDIVLMIEGKPVHVNKQYLALWSPVFQEKFFGDSEDKEKEEIELKDVKYWEFIELLHVIYPCQKNVTDSYAEDLIELAHLFKIPIVSHRAEDALINSTSYTPMEKMRIADQYKLFRLLGHCLSHLNTTADVQAIKNDPIYEGLSETTRAALLDRLIEIAQ